MIAYLKGILKLKSPEQLILDVQGVGYQVAVSLNTFYELPPENFEVALYIHAYIREDQFALFGFLTLEERKLFQQLLKVNGVGPKVALNLLSGLTAHELCRAIAAGDSALLRRVPGVGQKVAEKIIIELKGKIQPTGGEVPAAGSAAASQTYDEALSALLHLGYNRPQAEQSLRRLDWEKGLALPEAIRQSLKQLARS